MGDCRQSAIRSSEAQGADDVFRAILGSVTPSSLSRRRFCAATAGLLVPVGAAGAASTRPQAPSILGAPRQVAAGPLSGEPLRVVTVQATLDHPQGLDADAAGTTWWISAVHRARRAGLLAVVDAASGEVSRVLEIHDGDCYHPGGLSRQGDTLWVPVAEYRRASRTIVQRYDTATLTRHSTFAVDDHIGCLAATGTELIGANWDARRFYGWTADGRELRWRTNPTEARYQDLKWVGGRLVAGGLLGDGGVIDVLEWPSLDLVHRLPVGRTDRGVVFTHEGLAVAGTHLLLMPEDDPVRVFVLPRPDEL